MPAEEVKQILQSFYYDLTAATTNVQLRGLLDFLPPSQLLMGVDVPFMPPWTVDAAVDTISNSPLFNDADLEQIFHTNALKLFPALAGRLASQETATLA